MDKTVLKFDLSPKDIRIRNILNKEFLELDIYAISDIYPNRNESTFTKESLENSKDTCYNKPILGSFDTLADDFREHNGEERYDKEFETEYWDCNGYTDEKILGVIRESDTVKIVEEKGLHWLKISCALWTYYTYRQVKKLLKSSTKKVSVEILVDKYHMDDNGIMVIEKFTLTGITILGDKISEGIPNAHLNVLDLIHEDKYSQQMKCLTFAYKQKDNIKNKPKTEGIQVTYKEKRDFLESRLADIMPKDENGYCSFWVCDFSDSDVVIRDYCANKFYKIGYTMNEEDNSVTFDLENKTEVFEGFKEFSEKTIEFNGEQKTIEDFSQMYSELQTEYDNYKNDMSQKVFTVTIDEQEYDINQVCEKYNADIEAKDATIEQFKTDLETMTNNYNTVNGELEDLKAQMKAKCEEEIRERGCQLADDEEDIEDEDREDIKEKCKNNQYSSINEVEDAIAKAVYKVHKNRKQANSFKSNIVISTPNKSEKDVFGRLQEFSGN